MMTYLDYPDHPITINIDTIQTQKKIHLVDDAGNMIAVLTLWNTPRGVDVSVVECIDNGRLGDLSGTERRVGAESNLINEYATGMWEVTVQVEKIRRSV